RRPRSASFSRTRSRSPISVTVRRPSPCCARPDCCEPPPGPPPMTADTLTGRSRERAAATPRRAQRPAALLTVSYLVAAILALPLVFLLIEAQGAGTADVAHLIWRPLTGTLLWNTVRLAVVVTVACAVIGTAAAWCVERTDLPGG